MKEKLLSNVDVDKVVKRIQDLVRIPSCEDISKQGAYEKEKADYLEKAMRDIGLDTYNEGEAEYGRPTLLGFLRGKNEQTGLYLAAHLDTHPPPDTMKNPWSGTIEKGEVKGLGTGDSMTPLAAFLGALEAVSKTGIRLKKSALMIANSDEFVHSRGIQLAINWMKANDVKPEFGIIGEPTDLRVGIAHTAFMEWEVEILGITGHPGFIEPKMAKEKKLPYVNAVIYAADVIKTLLEMFATEKRYQVEHPLVGKAPFWIGPIEGGSRYPGIGHAMANYEELPPGMRSYDAFHLRGHAFALIAPEYCKVRFGSRVIPRRLKQGEVLTVEPEKGFTTEELTKMVEKWLQKCARRLPNFRYRLRRTNDRGIPYEISPNEHHVALARETVRQVIGRKPDVMGTRHWTEGSRIAEQIGTPFVQISPTYMRYHRADEGCPIEDIAKVTKIYAMSILNFCEMA